MKNTQQLTALALALPLREDQEASAHGARGRGSADAVGALLAMILGLAIMVIAWRRQQR